MTHAGGHPHDPDRFLHLMHPENNYLRAVRLHYENTVDLHSALLKSPGYPRRLAYL